MQNTNTYAGYRYPSQIISHAVWLYHRFTLSFRDIEELLAARGITVSYETIGNWCQKFGQRYCSQIRKNRGQLGDTWYLDEVFIKINGVLHYLWRAFCATRSIRMVMKLAFWFKNVKTRKRRDDSLESYSKGNKSRQSG
ncbi:MAG: transposase-like protein [Gammaproteobacteria bacterium]|jgi:transposase-like protein